MFVITITIVVNDGLFHQNDPQLYANQALITFVGALILSVFSTTLGFYQSIIYLLTLVAYGALQYDVDNGHHILIYNHYEVVIYGLITCQFIPLLPKAPNFIRDFITNSRAMLANLRRYQKS
jgi:hypothetical protein